VAKRAWETAETGVVVAGAGRIVACFAAATVAMAEQLAATCETDSPGLDSVHRPSYRQAPFLQGSFLEACPCSVGVVGLTASGVAAEASARGPCCSEKEALVGIPARAWAGLGVVMAVRACCTDFRAWSLASRQSVVRAWSARLGAPARLLLCQDGWPALVARGAVSR
jgi:hypothetical protein